MREELNKIGKIASLAVALALGAGGCASGNALRYNNIPRIISYVVANRDSYSANFIELHDRRLIGNGQGHEFWAEYTERYYEGEEIYEMIKKSKEHDVGNMSFGREFRCSTRINDPWSTPVLIRYIRGGSGDESFEITYQSRDGGAVTVRESVKFLGEFKRSLDGIPEIVGSLEGIRAEFVPFSEMESREQEEVISDYQLILVGLNRALNRK